MTQEQNNQVNDLLVRAAIKHGQITKALYQRDADITEDDIGCVTAYLTAALEITTSSVPQSTKEVGE